MHDVVCEPYVQDSSDDCDEDTQLSSCTSGIDTQCSLASSSIESSELALVVAEPFEIDDDEPSLLADAIVPAPDARHDLALIASPQRSDRLARLLATSRNANNMESQKI